jgi:tRNA (uracil-5-)-methyltransferase
MECEYFGRCGSCTLHDQNYEEQLVDKKSRVSSLLSPFFVGDLEVFAGKDEHYRARAEFRIWHTGDQCDYAMGNITKDGIVTIDECPKVAGPIDAVMTPLKEMLNRSEELRHKLFAVEFLSTTTGEVLVNLIYHRRLDVEWEKEAKRLEEKLNIYIIGRSRKQKVVLSREFVAEVLTIDGRLYRYLYYEGGFTQPNPTVNIKMIGWASDQLKSVGGDLLELYCGLGNFTLPLSRYFDRVLATEVSKNSIRAAKENVELNGVQNISFVRMSSEEMVEAFDGARPFRRLAEAGVELADYRFSAVLIDPPRAGLDPATIELVRRFEYILYISCNPDTLARDLAVLCDTHMVISGAVFDQFPHTYHIESGVLLHNKSRHL